MNTATLHKSSASWLFVKVIGFMLAFGLYVNLTKVFTGSKLFLISTDLAVVGLFAMAAILWLAGKSRCGIIEILILAFGLLGAVELFHPNVPSILIGLEGYRRLAFQMLGLILGILAVRRREDIIYLWKILAICSVPVLLWGIKQFFVISDFDQALIDSTSADMDTWMIFGKVRSFGLFSGPFHLGIFAGLIFWLAIALRTETGQRRYSVLAALAVMGCVASLTRSSMIALAASVPLTLFFVLRTQRRRLIWTTTTVLLVAVGGFYIAKSTSSTVASLVEGYSVLESLQDDGRLQGRFTDYSHALNMLTENPLGAGMGSASDALGAHFTTVGNQHLTSHNLFIWVAVEMGFAGLWLFIAILISIVANIRKFIHIDEKPIAMAACGILTVILIAGLTGSTLSAYPVNLIFWTLSGCYIGYYRIRTTNLVKAGDR